MIRWSYVLPRLLIVVAILAFVAFAMDPLIHWGVQRAGSQLLGAKVELVGVQTSLAGAKLRLNGLRAADPSDPMRNLLQAEAVYLDVDAQSLLLRRLVVERGHIAGVQLDTERSESGQLTGDVRPASEESGFEFDELLGALAVGALDELTKDFETIQLIETAEDRWDGKTDELKRRVEDLKQRVQQFRDRYRNINTRDPRQLAEVLQQAPRDLDVLNRDLAELRAEIDGLQNAVVNEFQDLSAARDRDLQRWRRKLRIREVNAMQFSRYLLGPSLEARLDEAMEWVEAGQGLAAKTAKPKGRDFSTREIRFGDVIDPPDCLIRELIVDGQLMVNGKPCDFAAVASDVAYPPERHSRPIKLRMKTAGEIDAQITGVLDYRHEEAVQQFDILCPELVLPGQQLGKAGKLAVQTAAGRAVVRCQVRLRGGQIQGRVDFHQADAQLTAEVSEKLGPAVAQSLQDSLGKIKTLNATLYFEGDPRRPNYRIESQLGEQMAAAFRNAAQAEVARQEVKVKQRLDKEVQTRLASFQAKAEAKKRELLADLNLNPQQLQQLLNVLPGQSVGRSPLPLPINGLFRR